MLRFRKTNIVGYELLAGIIGILQIRELFDTPVCIRHFIDSQPALHTIVKGSSRQQDLNCITGALWYQAAGNMRHYWASYVRSEANVADGPSRRKFHMMKQLQAREITFNYQRLCDAVETWMRMPRRFSLALEER